MKQILFVVLLATILGGQDVQAQTRPGGASGHSASERREAEKQNARLSLQLGKITKQFSLKDRTVNQIALNVGLGNRFTDAKLIEVVTTLAADARAMKDRNKQLETQLQALDDPLLRDPALAAVKRAEEAIDEGRFEDAEAAYGEAVALRWEESENARASWDELVEQQITAAELAQDFQKVEEIGFAASAREIQFSKAAHYRGFVKADSTAFRIYEKQGLLLGERSAIDRAILLYNTRVLPLVPREQYPELWAWAQNGLGIALKVQGERMNGVEGLDLLARAVTTYESALEVYAQEQIPADWAMTQNHLGNALQRQGERTIGFEGLELLARAVAAYEAALEVYTRVEMPTEWAMTQNNLGTALWRQGERTSGGEGLDLLVRAVSALEAALEVYTRGEKPTKWAMTQHNLGSALLSQAQRTGGVQWVDLLARVVSAFEAALEVRTRGEMPVDWAMTQNNLGLALMTQGAHTGGVEGLDLLERALSAYEAALEVLTRGEMPVHWAGTQVNIGFAQEGMADLSEIPEKRERLEQSVAAFEAALTVYTLEHMSYDYGTTTEALDRVRTKIAALDAGGA